MEAGGWEKATGFAENVVSVLGRISSGSNSQKLL